MTDEIIYRTLTLKRLKRLAKAQVGDKPGHPFHGNQYTDMIAGVGESEEEYQRRRKWERKQARKEKTKTPASTGTSVVPPDKAKTAVQAASEITPKKSKEEFVPGYATEADYAVAHPGHKVVIPTGKRPEKMREAWKKLPPGHTLSASGKYAEYTDLTYNGDYFTGRRNDGEIVDINPWQLESYHYAKSDTSSATPVNQPSKTISQVQKPKTSHHLVDQPDPHKEKPISGFKSGFGSSKKPSSTPQKQLGEVFDERLTPKSAALYKLPKKMRSTGELKEAVKKLHNDNFQTGSGYPSSDRPVSIWSQSGNEATFTFHGASPQEARDWVESYMYYQNIPVSAVSAHPGSDSEFADDWTDVDITFPWTPKDKQIDKSRTVSWQWHKQAEEAGVPYRYFDNEFGAK